MATRHAPPWYKNVTQSSRHITVDHMSLAQGTCLGPYEVTGFLGAGGMGEVWRARDSKLQRDVALKILPAAFAADPDRRARFGREAQLLASLNHPNIAAIYRLEETPDSCALVLELVEGPTLADRIARGPMPLDEALPIARQIGEALDAAHQLGIVHRDLKPANVKVRPDNTVKVLDFGLAKALEPTSSTNAHPLTSPAMTELGAVLGTAAYMSPEQARGRAADKRSDVWAFGCVLYEMLTGKRAFSGDDSSDTMAAILRSEPDWEALPPSLPAPLRTLMHRCLAKDPARRLRDIGDARFEIEEGGTPSDTGLARVPPPKRARAVLGSGVVGLVAGLTIAIAAVVVRAPIPAPEIRLELNTPGALDVFSFALSPDGRAIAFAVSADGQRHLWLRLLDAGEATLLQGTEGARYPFWSPDSRSIGFFADGELKRLDLDGGAPRSLARATPGAGGSWGLDDQILFAPTRQAGLFRVGAAGGEVVPVTRIESDATRAHVFPQLLADHRFLFYAVGTPSTRGIYWGSLDEPEAARLLTQADGAGFYVASGWLLFPREGVLLAQRFDTARGQLSGDALVVAESVDTDEIHSRSYTAAASGMVAYAEHDTRSRLTWVDRAGRELEAFGVATNGELFDPEISPEGGRVAVTSTRQGSADIWILDEIRATRFTLDAANDQLPVWSADGARLLFQTDRNGTRDLYIGPASAPGREQPLLRSPEAKLPSDWSPADGALLYEVPGVGQGMTATSIDIWIRPLDDGAEPYRWLDAPGIELWGQFSPDGRFVAYHSDESGYAQYEIYVRRFAEPDERWSISTAGGTYARWAPDGSELYYLAPDGNLMAVPIEIRDERVIAGLPQPLFRPRIVGGTQNIVGRKHQYDVATDGRFLVNVERADSGASALKLLLNWDPE